MTLILSSLLAGYGYQVSDRQATSGDQAWDSRWNKTVILRTSDALVSISFSGAAFVDGRPTDLWATEVLSNIKLNDGAMFSIRVPEVRIGLSTSLKRLVSAHRGLRSCPQLHAVAVGFRIEAHRVEGCAYEISNLQVGGPLTIHRVTRRKRQRFGLLMADPPGWVTGGRLESLNDALTAASSSDERENLLIELVRELSQAGLPIGPHVMCVRIPAKDPRPRIRFAPTHEHLVTLVDDSGFQTAPLPAIYTPAIVTPSAAASAQLSTGPPFAHVGGLDIDWELPPMPPPDVGGGRLTWLTQGQPRRTFP